MNVSQLNNVGPTISVLMPVFNAERYIRAAVKSVLDQSFGDFELLALDGGSDDKCVSILNEFAANDSRVRVLSKPGRALVPSLNDMIVLSRGRYLARMDGDDICRPQRFEKQVAYLDAHLDCVAVGTQALVIDPEGMPICEFAYKSNHEEIDARQVSGVGESQICHPSVMMRSDAIARIGRYCEEFRYAEDMDLFLRLGEVGKLANLPEVLLEYRQHLKSACHSNILELRRFTRKAVEEAWKRRDITTRDKISEAEVKPETTAETHRKWAWWALSAGNVATARKHAIVAFVMEPFSIKNFRAAASSIRGY